MAQAMQSQWLIASQVPNAELNYHFRDQWAQRTG